MSNILLTNRMIKDYTGSELDVCSIGSALVQMGYRVEAAAYELGEPLMLQFKDSGILFTNVKEKNLVLKEYDIIIGHHNTIFMDCLIRKDIKYKKVIFSSLSPWVSIEYPPECANDLTLCMANSSETYDRMKTLGVKEENIIIFPNYILPEYFETMRENRKMLQKICIVSNHVAEEIKEAVAIFRSNGIETDIFGQEYQSVLVTPELLVRYDVVITIGKTVQYCFGCKVPVYCYDIHGGPGWLNKNNFAIAANYNFSGRGFDRKVTGVELVMDIIQGYLPALQNLELFHQIGRERYDLQVNLRRLLEKIHSLPEINQEEFKKNINKGR
ncbi:MAG: hypothetical protein PUD93_02385 [Lachnospiraceae bacterium]|nr:hypothetical protein [Lachnospiraceae bacterium]